MRQAILLILTLFTLKANLAMAIEEPQYNVVSKTQIKMTAPLSQKSQSEKVVVYRYSRSWLEVVN